MNPQKAPPKGSGRPRCRRHLPQGRTLHLVDIENLAGGSGATAAAVGQAVTAYQAALAIRAGDHVVISSGQALALAAQLAWPGALLRVTHGLDGADLALINDAHSVDLAACYDRVVIGSGDGIFAALAAELRIAGLVVCVVSRTGALSAGLRRSASLVRLLEAEGPTAILPLAIPGSRRNPVSPGR